MSTDDSTSGEGRLRAVVGALQTAHRQGDDATFHRLCVEHAAMLAEGHERWRKVPKQLRADPQRNLGSIQSYAQMAHRLAGELDRLGHPEPLRLLHGAAGPESPFDKIHRAQTLSEDGEHHACEALLLEVLGDHVGPPAFTAQVYDLLAASAARRDDLDKAIEHAEKSQRLAAENETALPDESAATLEALLVVRGLRQGTDDGKRVAACRASITRAQKLSDRSRFTDSNRVLRTLLEEIDRKPADAPERRYLGKIFGLLGLNHFHLGEHDVAATTTERAITECAGAGDRHGEQVYRDNLDEIRHAARGRSASDSSSS